MRDDMEFIRRTAPSRAMRSLLGAFIALALAILSAHDASALAPFDAPSFREMRLVGDLVSPPNRFRNAPRLELLEPGQLVTSLRLTAGTYSFLIVDTSRDTLGSGLSFGGAGTPYAVPGGDYGFTPVTDGAVPIQIQVATTGWYVFSIDTEARTWRADPKPAVPNLMVRAFAGVPASTGADSTVTRKTTVRWLRDGEAEARSDFGGYRIYRKYTERDTTNMDLVRRFAENDTLLWHFDANQSVLQFVDPDSSGNLVKVCRIVDNLGRCVTVGDSVYAIVPPPGPHEGFSVYYTVTLGSIDQTLRETADMFIADTLDAYARCNVPGDPTSCPNLNSKDRNLIDEPVFVSGAATTNVEQVFVVPNPYRGGERWDEPGVNRVQFFNLPAKVTVRVFTMAGDLVQELRHDDPLSGNLTWNLKNADGRDVSSGIYLFHVVSEQGFEQKGHFVVIR
jgi:hypothetical protein